MADLLLIARLAGKTVAFPAADVEAVVELEGLTPVPGAGPHVAGLSALRSRVLTVIDCHASLGFRSPQRGALMEALVVPSGGHTYALLVDKVEDVVEAPGAAAPLQAPLGAGWDRAALGTSEADGALVLVVDPHVLIAGPAAQAA